jgi:hypothetical protein
MGCKLFYLRLAKILRVPHYLRPGRQTRRSPALSTGTSRRIPQDVAQKLRLQPLRAQFSTDVQGSLFLRNVLAPGTEIKHRKPEHLRGCPHAPPVVCIPFEDPAIGTRTPIIRVGRQRLWTDCTHLNSVWKTRLSITPAPVFYRNRPGERHAQPDPLPVKIYAAESGLAPTCTASTFGEAAGISPGHPASPAQCAEDRAPRR